MRNTFTLILTLFICNILCAQIPTQTIRGRVVDSESQYPLVGVKLEIKLDDVSSVRALTDTEGNFEFSKILLPDESAGFLTDQVKKEFEQEKLKKIHIDNCAEQILKDKDDIIKKMEEKEERWFELSSKME